MEREDLEDLIQNFGIAVLGKDQESADDVQPTADHSHVNIKVDTCQQIFGLILYLCIFQALIDELFHPSSTTTTTTTTPATTSTQRLPIKAHELGWELSPVDLVMANSVLEPVFSDDQKQVRVQIMFQEAKLCQEIEHLSDYLTHIYTPTSPHISAPIDEAEDAR